MTTIQATRTAQKISIVTGALGALGKPLATELARQGHRVVIVGRGVERLEEARRDVAASSGNAAIEILECDFADLGSVRAAASEIARRHPAIDVLVNNAAAYSGTRRTSKDGYELMVATNHLGPYLFTRLLEAPLAKARGRVVFMTMPTKKEPRFTDLMSEQKFSALDTFFMSKGLGHYFIRELAERWAGKVSVFGVNPDMTKTSLIREAPLPLRIIFALFGASPEKAVAGAVQAATSPELSGRTGLYLAKKKGETFMPTSDDKIARVRVWDVSAQLTSVAA
jgi:NAD(P)-dependent dehydrogenase (short-subunit alcohol dehydrogenase family)